MQGVACVYVERNQKVCVHAAIPLVVHGGQFNAYSLALAVRLHKSVQLGLCVG
jgi:hypothetical protein